MRIRLPLGPSLFFLCAFLFALVALLPLRLGLDWLALDERGFAAREARGSIWFGRLSEAQLGSVPLGDLGARLNTLPLLLGRARVDLDRNDENDPFRGAVTVSRHRFGVDDVSGALDVGATFAPLPLSSLNTSDVTVHFENGLCASAEGLVTANVAGDIAGVALGGAMSGTARCDEGALLLPLVSQSGMEAVNIRLMGAGGYRVELAVQPTDDAARDRLVAAGFTPGAGGRYVSEATGEF